MKCFAIWKTWGMIEDWATARDGLAGTVIEGSYVDAYDAGGSFDLVLVMPDDQAVLYGCVARDGRWRATMSYEECQRLVTGATITALEVDETWSMVMLTLSNETILTGRTGR